MDPLKYDGLNPQKRSYLKVLTEHPGYAVLKELLEDACLQTTRAVIKTNPEDSNYEALLKSRQMVARITNDVVATLLKSVAMHSETAKLEAVQKEEEINAEEIKPKPLGSKFGSFTINPKKIEQPNQ